MISDDERSQVEKAFGTSGCGATATCNCGKTFFDCGGGNHWDWEHGEREALLANKEAVPLPYGVEQIMVQGRCYVTDCECWLDMAERLLTFLRGHQSEIGRWYRLEKRRLQEAAEDVPVICDPPRNGKRLLLN